MSSLFPPFLKWGNYKSKDESNPDEIVLILDDLSTFETEYSVNANAQVKIDDDLQEMTIPLKSYESANSSLLNMWQSNIESKNFKKGKKICLLTWVATSRNNRPIRRWRIA